MFPFGNNMYGVPVHSYQSGNQFDTIQYGFQSHSYDNYQPSYGYNQNQSFGYDPYPMEPYGYSHACQQTYDGYVREQPQGWKDSYASNKLFSNVGQRTKSLESKGYDIESIPTPLHRVFPSLFPKEKILHNGGKRINIRKLYARYNKLEEAGASQKTLDEINKAIDMEFERRFDVDDFEVDTDSDEYEEPLESPCSNGNVIPTLDHNNDHSPIQKEGNGHDITVVINGVTYSNNDFKICTNELDFLGEDSDSDDDIVEEMEIEKETKLIKVVKDPVELAKDYNDDETSSEAETDEEWLKSLIEDHDTHEVNNSLQFFKNDKDPVIQEIVEGLSNPLHISKSFGPHHLGLSICASKSLKNYFASKYPPLDVFDSSIVQVHQAEEPVEVPKFYVLYPLPSVERNKCGGNFNKVIASIFISCANVFMKLLLEVQIVFWVDYQIFRLLVYGEVPCDKVDADPPELCDFAPSGGVI